MFDMEIGRSKKKQIYYGWWVVAALFVVGMLGPMARYSITLLGPFVSEELGWGATSIGLGLSICLWAYAFVSVPVGWMIDRVGSRRVIFIGGILLFAGLWGFSTIDSPWELYTRFSIVVGIGVSMTHYVATQSTARKWFVRRAGLAAGILAGAFWAGSALLSPIITSMAGTFGWRTALVIYAVSAGVIVSLLARLVVRDSPESMGLHPDGDTLSGSGLQTGASVREASWTVREAMGTRSFWMMFLAYCLIGIPSQGLMGHLVLWAVELGVAKTAAGFFITASSLSSVLTCVLGGWLADRFGKRRILATGYALTALVMVAAWLTVDSFGSLLILIVCYGLAWGLTAGPGLWAAYVGDLFGRASVGRLFGVLTLGFGLLGGTGPVIWGRIHDITGTYNIASLASAFCFLLAIGGIVLARPVVRRPS